MTESHAKSSPVLEILLHLNQKISKLKKGKFLVTAEANTKPIKARLNEGYTVEDCMAAIDWCVMAWGNESAMKRYIRPQTIFGASKFPSYLSNSQELVKKPLGEAVCPVPEAIVTQATIAAVRAIIQKMKIDDQGAAACEA